MDKSKACGGHALRITVGITMVLLLAGGVEAVTPISSCTTISSPGEYVLNQGILNSGASSCINITSSNVFFDGAGYTIDGIDAEYSYGVYVSNSTTVLTNVTVKNLKVTDWYDGIDYKNTHNGSIANSTANSNNIYGITLSSSNNNTLSENNASNNGYGIFLSSSSNNTLSGNNASNNANTGTFLSSSSNNMLSGNNASNNNYGIILSESSNNTLSSNTVNSNRGIELSFSSNNTLTGNNASNNEIGIYLLSSSNNTVNENNASNNRFYGIDLSFSSNNNTMSGNNASNNDIGIYLLDSPSNNTLTGNNASNNNYGIYLDSSSNNKIYNNIFNNTNNVQFYGSNINKWNITKQSGTNILEGSLLGGNFWAQPDGNGYSQKCVDSEPDGICDLPNELDSNNIDYLPLAIPTAGAFGQGMFIPAYFYPGSLWDQADSGAPAVEIMIMNPASGPSTIQDSNYVNAVNNSLAAGIKVIGYVYTNYSARDPVEVKSEIDSYKSWYNVSGIFLDEVSSVSDNAHIQYYQDLANYIRSASGTFVVLNPGTIPAEDYINIGNTTVIFEGDYNTYKTWTPPDWVFNYSPYKFTHLVYDTSTSANMEDAIKRAQTNNSYYVYVTNDTLPNPWDTLPSYWSSELDLLNAKTPTNLVISKNGPVTKDNGTQMTYDLFYNNFGGIPASNVVIVDNISTNVVYVSSNPAGTYDSDARTVTWNLGTVSTWPTSNGVVHVNVSIPSEVPIGTQIGNTASISTDTLEETYTDNSVTIQTTVTGSGLPPGAGIETPNSGGNTPSVFWGNPTTFTYQSCGTATGVDIRIQISDGGPDITGSMTGGPPDWSNETTFYPRHGAATVTYTVSGCSVSSVNFKIYIDPAGYVYDVITNARIPGALVTLQRPDGRGDWENVPVKAAPPIMQPDTNPLTTGLDGQYEWLTLAGTYRVHVEAVGYYPADSGWVTVPPPVTDLHVGLRRMLYNFNGFFQPVDNIPTLNTVKAGTGIPIKFNLSGNQGLNIFPSGYPKSQKISCDTTAPMDEINETVTAGQSSLSYDATADQYKYVWKTDKAWSNTCRQMILRLNDGTNHLANFKFR